MILFFDLSSPFGPDSGPIRAWMVMILVDSSATRCSSEGMRLCCPTHASRQREPSRWSDWWITEWNHSLRPIRWQHLCALSIQRNSLLSLPNVVKMVAKRENDQLFFGICPKYHHARTQLTIKSESFRRRPFRKQLELVDSTWNSAHSARDRAGIRAGPYCNCIITG